MTEQPVGTHAGDLARRVSERRSELGLSSGEVAKRAGMSDAYFSYLEQSPDSALSNGALLRLAVALDTTTLALEGAEVDRPPGLGQAGTHPTLRSLSEAECETHLAAGGIGRIIFTYDDGPVAVPVNFVYDSGCVVFTTDDAMAEKIRSKSVVGFEVDRIDEAMSEGWSVLVSGRARRVERDEDRERIAALNLEPWAGGVRDNLVRIEPDELSGRVIVQRSTK